jgi:autotransporter-associated beta strand protein
MNGSITAQQEELIFTGNSNAGSSQTLIENLAGLGTTAFYDNASAGSAQIQNGPDYAGGYTTFHNNSTAGNATITNYVGGILAYDNSTLGNANITNINLGSSSFPYVLLFGNATAGNATITNNANVTFTGNTTGGTATITNYGPYGTTIFADSSNADHATLIAESGGSIQFLSSATAGNALIRNSGSTDFYNTSTAGNATITTLAGGVTTFHDASLGGPTASITTDSGAETDFQDNSSAQSATITTNGGGITKFFDSSTGGTATIITNSGGVTSFFDSSTGGTARFITNSGGIVDISTLTAAGMTSGSIEGAGNYFLGSKELTTGLNNLSTEVSGVISDGGAGGGTGGSLIKAGSGTLTLTNDNTYTGGTTISGGTLQLGNGGTTGNILGDVVDNGTLVFNHSGTASGVKRSFDGVISGTGSVVKLGPDTLELTANNTFSGGTTINDGILVAGIPAGSTQITSFALGRGDVFLQSGILRAPTLDPLTIFVGGNYTQGPAGELQLGVAGIDGKDYDHVVAGGSASVDGTLSVFSLGGFARSGFGLARSNSSASFSNAFSSSRLRFKVALN